MNTKGIPINLLLVAAAVNRALPPLAGLDKVGRFVADKCRGLDKTQIKTIQRLVEKMRK